jgi:capsule biosynthesis phosphatase
MRIAIDVDGTLCAFKQGNQTYADVAPLPGAVEKVRGMHAAGHYIILMTARHMKTCGGNVGMVVARQGKTLLNWLEQHGIPYDEIWFGKPQADVYIDDNAYRLESWDPIAADGSNLPISKEQRAAQAAPAAQETVFRH